MQSIQIIDKYHIRLHKAFWTDDEIFTAKCVEMKVEDNVITCDVRITWKRSLGGFIRKCYPQMCLTRKDYVESLFLQFNEMYKGAIKEFKETYALRLDYSKVGKQLREYQIETIFRTVHSKYKLLALEMGTGKAQNVDSKIITPNGETRMGDLKVGDKVFGSDGKPCSVIGVYPQGKQDLYKIHLSDGSTTECCINHLWIVVSNIASPKDKYRRVMSTKELIESGLFKGSGNNAKWHIPYTQPVQFPKMDYGVLDPYLLGLLLGDGCFRKVISFSTNDIEIVHTIQTLLPFDNVYIKKSKCNDYGYALSVEGRGVSNPLINEIKNLGLYNKLSHEKFIPKEYLLNDIPTRLAILQGLMDTDGSVSKTGNRITFSTVSPMLAEQVKWIVLSLGGHCTVANCIRDGKRDGYSLQMIFENGLIPFRLKRHIDKLKPKQRVKRRNIIKIEKLPPVEQQCISVDSYDHSYLTDNFIVTHNTITSATVSKVMRANRTCVVCPSIAKWNWYEDMTKEWGYSDTKWTIIEPKNRKGIHAIEERFVVINYEMVGKNLANFKNRTINHFIVDECHSIKNPQAIKTKDLTKLYKMYPDAKITLLSGTPWTNRVTDLYSYLKLCKHPLGLLSKKYFEDTYAIKNGSKVVGTKNMDDLRLKLSNFMIRLKSDDVLDLPKLIINKAYFEIGSLKNEYNDVLKEMADLRKEYDEADDEETKKSFKFASRMRQSISSLSRITAMSKIPDVVKWVEDLNSNGKKVVIFSSWRGVLEELENRFNGGTVRVDGSVPPQKRQELVNQFKNNDNTMVFLGQVKAAGVAINLVNSQLVILMDVPISPDLIEQPIKRLHRSGQKGVVNAFFTFARGTVDERLYSLITEKAGDINAIIDANSKKGVVSYENIPEQLFKELTNKQL